MPSNTDERYAKEASDLEEPAAMHEEEKNHGARYAEERRNQPVIDAELRRPIDVADVRAVMYKMDQEKALENLVNKNDFKPTNPKDILATTRLDLTTFPDTAVVYGSLGMMEGHLKYGAFNYRVGGVLASVYIAAARRHMAKYYNGEWADQKTEVPHLASALACIAIIIDAHECGVLTDDRPPRHPDMEKFFDEMEAHVKHLADTFPPENSPGRYTEAEHGEKHSTTKTLHSSISGGSPIPPGSDN